MSRYNYPFHFTETLWSTIDADIYVSPIGDNVTGNGSPKKPYQTIQAAVNAAPETAKIVLAPGIYQEAVDGLEKSLIISGEGDVVLDGTAIPTVPAFKNMGLGYQTGFYGLTIQNYSEVVEQLTGNILHCNIIGSSITNFQGLLEFCLIKNGDLKTSGVTNLVNCTLINVNCGEEATGSNEFRVIANTYVDSQSRLELNTVSLKKWNYCAIETGAILQVNDIIFNDVELLKISHPQWLVNHVVPNNSSFNNPLANDYTLIEDSDLLSAGMYNYFIGCSDLSLRLESATLATTELTNIELDGNGYFKITNENNLSGTIVTQNIDLGKLALLGKVNLFSNQDISNPLNGRVDFDNTIRASNLCTYKMRFSSIPNDLEDKDFGEFPWNEAPLVDQNGKGNGHSAFQRSNAKPIITRYIQIKASIQTADAFSLSYESGDLFQQEDNDLILL